MATSWLVTLLVGQVVLWRAGNRRFGRESNIVGGRAEQTGHGGDRMVACVVRSAWQVGEVANFPGGPSGT